MDRIRRLEWPQRLSLAREKGVAPCLCMGLVPDVGIPARISSSDDNALGFCILGMRRRPSSGRKAHTSRGGRNRKRVGWGKSGSVWVDLGGRVTIQKKKKT